MTCPGCVGDFTYDHAAGCDRFLPIEDCPCAAVETFVHDVWCDEVGVLTRWPDHNDHHYPRRKVGY